MGVSSSSHWSCADYQTMTIRVRVWIHTKISKVSLDKATQVFSFAIEVVGKTDCSVGRLVADFEVPDRCDVVSTVIADFFAL